MTQSQVGSFGLSVIRQRYHLSGGAQGLIFSLPLLLALWLALVAARHQPVVAAEYWLKPVYVSSVAEIEDLFDRLGYEWPLPVDAEVPRVLINDLPAELNNSLSVSRKKALFLRILLPVVLAENQRVRQQRVWLLQRFSTGVPVRNSLAWRQLQQLADDYRVKGDLNDRQLQGRLLQRVDEIPIALVLAQAANESGWGTSRFVQQANNLFGHWTYRVDQGLVPLQRDGDKTHRVRIFPTLRSSVQAYLKNLNTGRAYTRLRMLRSILRDNNQPLDGEHLAAGLIHYSERGEGYVEEIRRLIRVNHLEHFELLRLRQGTWHSALN